MILDFLARSWFFLDFLARLIAKILARNLRNPRSWQQMKKSKILARNSRIYKILGRKPRRQALGCLCALRFTFILSLNLTSLSMLPAVSFHFNSLWFLDQRFAIVSVPTASCLVLYPSDNRRSTRVLYFLENVKFLL